MSSEKVISILEYQKILDHISKYAYTENGKKKISHLKPFQNKTDALEAGSYVSEAKNAIIQNDIPPIEYLPDQQKALSNSRISGATLSIKQIKDISQLAKISRQVKKYLRSVCVESNLNLNYGQSLFSDHKFEDQIDRIFTPSGDIKDNASPELKKIRNKINEKGEALRKTVNKVLRELSDSMLVQEDYITQRDGRIVLPVKAEHKRHVKGFIHSESSTGQTIYIEPEESLELNNEILSLNFAEKREIERILRNLTGLVGEKSYELELSHSTLAQIDKYFAIAQYSNEIIGNYPTLNENEPLKIIDARHPLLLQKIGRKSTIPLNLELHNDRIIVITGPNAGGKTVVLKTVGLISLLIMSGIHVPLHVDSNLWFFENVLVDIGDMQSIEDDLSTFSSHLSNINKILHTSNSSSLVLLDELGTGTDPSEGSALAKSFLLELKNIGATVLATTHHGSLKLLANHESGFDNASMIFDVEKLEPTYQFRLGVPGSSYAFEVAKRIGIDEDIITIAKDNIDEDKNRLEDFLVELESKSNKMKEKLNQYEKENSRLSGLTKLYQTKVSQLELEKKKIIKETKEQAGDYLRNVNKEVELTIKRIKESNASRNVIVEEKEKIKALKEEIQDKSELQVNEGHNESISIGDYVQIKDTTTKGEIIDISGKVAQLVSGKIKLKAKLNRLLKVKREKKVSETYYSNYSASSPEIRIDIRGKKPEEIEFELLKFIDNAFTSNLTQIEIVHGKGTGVLKGTVHELLKKHYGVRSFEFAKIEMGGDGVTLANLK